MFRLTQLGNSLEYLVEFWRWWFVEFPGEILALLWGLEFLKMWCASEWAEGLVKTQITGLQLQGFWFRNWEGKICISNKFPGNAAGLGMAQWLSIV